MLPGPRDGVPETGTPSPIGWTSESDGEPHTVGKVTTLATTSLLKMQYVVHVHAPHGRWKLLSQHSCETSAGKALQQRGEHACGVRLTPQGWSRRLTPSCTRCRRSPVAVDVFDDAVFHGARIESDQPKQGRGGLLKILSDNLPRAAGDAFLYHRPCVRAFNPVPRAAPHLSMLISHTLTVCGTLVRGKLSRIFFVDESWTTWRLERLLEPIT